MEQQIIANIKALGIDMINEAGSGHPGIVLGASPIIYTLYANHINVNVKDDKWPNRDRFVLSAGHGSALLYATLFMAGFNISLDELKRFRQFGSITPGHPEYLATPGVDVSTGPLGQGFANAVGMAIGEKILASKYLIDKNKSLFNYKIYVLCSDGDLMEGISNEAASLAGTLRLDNLIVLYDSNNVSLDGSTNDTFYENVLERFKALGWHTEYVADGEDIYSIDRAIERAKEVQKPSIIEVKTVIGKGSKYEGTNTVHGKNLDKDDILGIKDKLNISHNKFFVLNEAKESFSNKIKDRGTKKYDEWLDNYQEYVKLNGDSSIKFIFGKEDIPDITKLNWSFGDDANGEMRNLNNKVMNEIASYVNHFIGGSADLSSSVKTKLKDQDFTSTNNSGRNLLYGVREHAMAAISNGLALTHFRPYASTFLVFADYLKAALRLSAMMNLPVTYIFSHDSVAIGSDGPTHQPVEQLSMLRSTPNINVYRPADIKELIGSWNEILHSQNPSALVVSKTHVDKLDTTDMNQVKNGAYIIRKEQYRMHGIIIATGTEVHAAMNIAKELYEQYKLDLRVISMPCVELFLKQDNNYRESILPDGYRTIVIEAGSSYGWHQFVYNDKYMITIDRFGASGSTDDILKHLNFDYETIKKRIIELLK